MAKTPQGTSVGVEDPYAVVERCDHITDDGRCRFAAEHADRDPEFAHRRKVEDLRCPVVEPACEARSASTCASGERAADPGAADEQAARGASRERSDPQAGEWDWADCPHFRARQRSRACVRCGLEERRLAHADERPLLEEHHLEYRADDRTEPAHEITVYLCRWCHAKIHDSWARIDDDVAPDPEAIAEAEGRRSRELEEADFAPAAERYGDE